MLVPVVVVGGVPVAAVQVVDVIAMFDGVVSAPGAVHVTVVVLSDDVLRRLALVPVTFVSVVGVAVVQVVGVTFMRDRNMTALGMVLVGMDLMCCVSHGGYLSLSAAQASRARLAGLRMTALFVLLTA